MGSFHPTAGHIGNPWGPISAAMSRLAVQIRTLAARPPSGMLTAQRVDSPAPATSATDDTALWRIPPTLPGTAVLLGVIATVSATATGEVSIADGRGVELDRRTAPYAGDLGPYPAFHGQLTVSGVRTGGTGSVSVDCVAVRYGPALADDPADDDSGDGLGDTPAAYDPPAD